MKAALLCLFAAVSLAMEVMPVEELVPGMQGTARTVFSGYRIEEFPVEILGVMENYAAGRDMVLVRCGGPLVERTGVFAGMSGSPVYVDGRLVGALAYAFQFSKEPVAGVTPIGEMASVLDRGAGPGGAVGGVRAPLPRERVVDLLVDPFSLRWPLVRREPLRAPGFTELPLAICGTSGAGLADLASSLGGVAALGGGAAPEDGFEPLPGASVSVTLVSGDLDACAAGTLTAVDGDRVLAFGHPLFGAGAVSLPLAPAYVHTVVPSQAQSFKLASSGRPLGVVERDDETGLGGTLGEVPPGTQVEVLVRSQGGERRYSFAVVRDPWMGPLALGWALEGCLRRHTRAVGSATVRYQGSLQLAGGLVVPVSGAVAEMTSPISALGGILSTYVVLVRNPFEEVEVDRMSLVFDVCEEGQSAVIQTAWLEPLRARRGERVVATAVLAPYGGGRKRVRLEFTVPEDAPLGRLAVTLADGASARALRRSYSPARYSPTSLAQLVEVLSEQYPATRLYLLVDTGRTGVNRDGVDYPNLPGSLAALLGSQGRSGFSPVRSVVETWLDTEWVLAGTHTVYLEVVDGEN